MLLRLKVALLKRGISESQLARAIGAHPSTISRIIQGHTKPRPGDRRKIARVLGIPVRKLFPEIERQEKGCVSGKR